MSREGGIRVRNEKCIQNYCWRGERVCGRHRRVREVVLKCEISGSQGTDMKVAYFRDYPGEGGRKHI
jgi:hypothetical protein